MTTTHYDDPQTLAPGKYLARACEWAWDTGKDKDDGSPGDPCIAIMFCVEDDRAGSHNGIRLDRRLYLDEDRVDAKGRTPLDRTMEVLNVMGLVGDIPADLTVVDLTSGQVELVTEINPAGYAAIKFVNVPSAGGSSRELRTFAPPEPQQLNGFLAKLNAKSRALAARAQASGTRTAQTAPPPVARPAAPAQRAASANAAPRPVAAQSAQQRQTAQRQPPPRMPPRMPPSGAGEFGADDEIPF